MTFDEIENILARQLANVTSTVDTPLLQEHTDQLEDVELLIPLRVHDPALDGV
jgi:hypothetical protein